MEALLFAIIVIVAIVRGVYRLIRWAAASLKRQGVFSGDSAPPAPIAPQPSRIDAGGGPAPTPPPVPILPSPPRAPLQPIPFTKSAGDPPSTGFPSPNALISGPEVGPLFGTSSDLIRAFILQEVLGPPISQRKRPPTPWS